MTPIMSYLKDGRLSKARMRPESLGLEQPSMSFWTKYYTREAFLNLISDIWLQMKQTIC